MRSWTVREAGPDDIDVVRELYRAVRGQDRPQAYDHWRYVDLPQGSAPAALAMDGGRAAGFYVVWPTPLRIGIEAVSGAQSMDTMTHPDFRGQGVFTVLAQACYEIAKARGIRLLYGFPNGASYPGFVRRLEWSHVDSITHWVRPIRPSRKPGFPALFAWPADALSSVWPAGGSQGYDVAVISPDPQTLAELSADEVGAGLDCRIERAPEWIRWRYAPDAAQGYKWIAASTGGRMRALAVWGMQDETWCAGRDGRAHLVELAGSDAGARAAVLAAVISGASQQGAWVLETVTNAPDKIRTLRRAGFFTHRVAPLIVRALDRTVFVPDPFTIGAWRIIGGDLDTF